MINLKLLKLQVSVRVRQPKFPGSKHGLWIDQGTIWLQNVQCVSPFQSEPFKNFIWVLQKSSFLVTLVPRELTLIKTRSYQKLTKINKNCMPLKKSLHSSEVKNYFGSISFTKLCYDYLILSTYGQLDQEEFV